MPDAAGWAILVAAALVGSVVGGVAGFGAGVILLPVLVAVVGVRAAAPVLTVTMLLGNLSRVWWSRGEEDRRVVWRFLLGAVPATAAGAIVYAAIDAAWLRGLIGGFLIAAVPLRRFLLGRRTPVLLRHFPLIGVAFGLLSSVVVTVGPVLTPFYLAYGLRRGAYIATEALCALAMHATRSAVFARSSLLGWEAVALGAALGGTMFAGSWVARRLLDRMGEGLFLAVVEGLLIVMGLHTLLLSR